MHLLSRDRSPHPPPPPNPPPHNTTPPPPPFFFWALRTSHWHFPFVDISHAASPGPHHFTSDRLKTGDVAWVIYFRSPSRPPRSGTFLPLLLTFNLFYAFSLSPCIHQGSPWYRGFLLLFCLPGGGVSLFELATLKCPSSSSQLSVPLYPTS